MMVKFVQLPFCTVVMLDVWNASPSRYFAAYRCLDSYRWLLGHPVIDEFATISSPIFITPRSLLGKIYNAGISLGHRRDPEMGIDQGWPPLCVGLDTAAPKLPSEWEAQLLDAVVAEASSGDSTEKAAEVRRATSAGYQVEGLRIGEASIVVTSGPLLPKQLAYLCEAASSAVVVAVSLGNRLERVGEGARRTVRALSRRDLSVLRGVVEEVLT